MLPYFIQASFIKDEEGRSLSDPEYDPSTLFIPIQDYQKMSPMFKQYWNAKKKNFDKVMFFRFGRWLHVFY
jgi:DNA mismatch repair protein MSH6